MARLSCIRSLPRNESLALHSGEGRVGNGDKRLSMLLMSLHFESQTRIPKAG